MASDPRSFYFDIERKPDLGRIALAGEAPARVDLRLREVLALDLVGRGKARAQRRVEAHAVAAADPVSAARAPDEELVHLRMAQQVEAPQAIGLRERDA